MLFSVDRLRGDGTAVLIGDAGEELIVRCSEFSRNPNEGDVVFSENGCWNIDDALTEQRRGRALELLNQLQ
ncbi:MAG: DUF3006 domain-containing protein [Oscillospiraceae bacterium]